MNATKKALLEQVKRIAKKVISKDMHNEPTAHIKNEKLKMYVEAEILRQFVEVNDLDVVNSLIWEEGFFTMTGSDEPREIKEVIGVFRYMEIPDHITLAVVYDMADQDIPVDYETATERLNEFLQ